MKNIKNILKQYLRADDKILLGMLAAVIPLMLGYYFANALGAQFTGAAFITFKSFELAPLMLLLFAVAVYARDMTPKVSLVTWSYTLYFFIVLICNSMIYFVQLTPFHPIDFSLVHIDKMLGFNQLAWLDWTYAHPTIAKFVNDCYGLLYTELAVVPLILALLMEKRALRILFMSIMISFVVGTGIYYFMPTVAPATMFHDSHFALQQHDTFIKFYEIHHKLPVTTMKGGLIAFPSFHVIWSVLMAYSFRRKKYWFIPFALYNTVVILSTIMLGWHYLTDVIGGFAVAGFAILLSELIHKKFLAEPKTKKIAYHEEEKANALSLSPILAKHVEK